MKSLIGVNMRTITKIAMNRQMKFQMINDFARSVGVMDLTEYGDTAVGIYNDLVTAMYSVMDVKVVEKDDLEQMLNLYLAGMNPSSYWSEGKLKETLSDDAVDKAQAFLSAFSDRSTAVWASLWGSRDPSSIEDIKITFAQMKTSLRQRARDEVRQEKARTRDMVQIDNSSDDSDSAQAYQNAMEGEISRSVGVGQTFNLNSWDEIQAAGNRDEKVGQAVADIEALFASNVSQIALAVMDIAFVGDRKTDAFERKLFEIANSVGDYSVKVTTLFGDIDIDQKITVGRPVALKSKNWITNLTAHLVVTRYPELRYLVVPDKKVKNLPEGDFRDLLDGKHTRPFSNASISLPQHLSISARDIARNSDAQTIVGRFDPSSTGVESKDGVIAMTNKSFIKLMKAARESLNQKWVSGKRLRNKPFWKKGMDCLVRQVQIDFETDPTTWLDYVELPSSVSAETTRFVENFRFLLIRALVDLDEAHGWYELRNKRFAKKKEAKQHRLASKVAYKWLLKQSKA